MLQLAWEPNFSCKLNFLYKSNSELLNQPKKFSRVCWIPNSKIRGKSSVKGLLSYYQTYNKQTNKQANRVYLLSYIVVAQGRYFFQFDPNIRWFKNQPKQKLRSGHKSILWVFLIFNNDLFRCWVCCVYVWQQGHPDPSLPTSLSLQRMRRLTSLPGDELFPAFS